MRLINVVTLEMKDFVDDEIPQYAILSHTWGDEEISFQEWQTIASLPDLLAARPSGQDDAYTTLQRNRVDTLRRRAGYKKILDFCRIVFHFNQHQGCGLRRLDPLPQDRRGRGQIQKMGWVWIDTCCIDKTSSSELSEAINSMFRWYGQAEMCLAYLSDVPDVTDPQLANPAAAFKSSRWFTRGWTLQELLAPDRVLFLDAKWNVIGLKDGVWEIRRGTETVNHELPTLIQETTGIDEYYLRCPNLEVASVAARMAWASKRKTTRVEDQAYCLLGIFNIHMPLLYGEGTNAFIRLQEEILKSSTDMSILAWGYDMPLGNDHAFHNLLAPSPAYFSNMRNVAGLNNRDAFQMTNKGLNITLTLHPYGNSNSIMFAPLYRDRARRPFDAPRLALLLRRPGHDYKMTKDTTARKLPMCPPVAILHEPPRSQGLVRSVFIPRRSTLDPPVRHSYPLELSFRWPPGFNTFWDLVETFPPIELDGPRTLSNELGYSQCYSLNLGHQPRNQNTPQEKWTWLLRFQGPVPFMFGLRVAAHPEWLIQSELVGWDNEWESDTELVDLDSVEVAMFPAIKNPGSGELVEFSLGDVYSTKSVQNDDWESIPVRNTAATEIWDWTVKFRGKARIVVEGNRHRLNMELVSI